MEQHKMNYWKTFLIGFGFFGVSVLWSLYNTYVPILLEKRFAFDSVATGFFMSLDNIAALFIQPAVGAWSDRLRTRLGRRCACPCHCAARSHASPWRWAKYK